MLARKIIESLNVSPIYFIVAFNLSQNLSLIAGICIYDCKPIHLTTSCMRLKFRKTDLYIHLQKSIIWVCGRLRGILYKL